MNVTTTIPSRFRGQVKASHAFQKLSRIQQTIYSTGQNFRAIYKGLLIAKTVGITRWREVSGNSAVNSEIIEELYLNQLEVEISIVK